MMDISTKNFNKVFDPALDLGISNEVNILVANGIETFESCEGGKGHAYLEPTVRFHGDSSEGYKAFAIAIQYKLAVTGLRRIYTVSGSELEGPWWELTFSPTKGK